MPLTEAIDMSVASSEASYYTALEEKFSPLGSLAMDMFERMFGGPSAAPPADLSAGTSAVPSATPSGTAAEDVLRRHHQDFLDDLVQGGRVALPGNYRAPRPVVPAPNVQPPDVRDCCPCTVLGHRCTRPAGTCTYRFHVCARLVSRSALISYIC